MEECRVGVYIGDFQVSRKHRHILNEWDGGYGIYAVRLFEHLTKSTAKVYEAALIRAFGM